MPFVPLGQRKPIPLILDGDKAEIAARQRERDLAAVQRHLGAAPGASGYRFANLPPTLGHARGPEVPFRDAHASWRPPEADPDGPASLRNSQQAGYGAYWESSHGLRKARSSPTLQSPANANAREACHPLSTELRRWEHMAETTRRCDMKGMKDVEWDPLAKPARQDEAPKAAPGRQGLVMFPKYMLINNCHLKSTDLQRFQREQMEEQRRRADEASQQTEAPGGPAEGQGSPKVVPRPGPVKFDASWGRPVLREPSQGGPHWAGSALPHGRGARTSNPFRMG